MVKNEKEESGEMYCGAGDLPRGKIRGTPEYCVQTNQVRYYGIKKINPELLKPKVKVLTLDKQVLKFRKLQDSAKIFVNESKKLKLILSDEELSKAKRKAAEKRMDALKVRGRALSKKLEAQQKIVDQMELDEKRASKAAAKEKAERRAAREKEEKKTSRSGSKSSGSKTSRTKSSSSKSSSRSTSGSKSSGRK